MENDNLIADTEDLEITAMTLRLKSFGRLEHSRRKFEASKPYSFRRLENRVNKYMEQGKECKDQDEKLNLIDDLYTYKKHKKDLFYKQMQDMVEGDDFIFELTNYYEKNKYIFQYNNNLIDQTITKIKSLL